MGERGRKLEVKVCNPNGYFPEFAHEVTLFHFMQFTQGEFGASESNYWPVFRAALLTIFFVSIWCMQLKCPFGH